MSDIYEEEGVTVEEYIDAFEQLKPKSKKLLYSLYDNDSNHSASEKELSEKMGYLNEHSSSLQIGRVGKEIAKYLSKEPKNTYHDKGKDNPAWFHFVGGRFKNEKPSEKDDKRWEMTENLCKAIERIERK